MRGSVAERTGIGPWRYESPVASEYGVLRYRGERLVCHVCGRDYACLATHIRVHGMTAHGYRSEFRLHNTVRLRADRLLRYHREQFVKHGLDKLNRRELGAGRAVDVPADRCLRGHVWDGYKRRNGKKWQRQCRQCNRDQVKAWRIAHPDRFRLGRARTRAAKEAADRLKEALR